jgi:sulfite exporter TauE/SafE
MVYMALTASLAAGGIWQSATFMALFGLGTLPFMFAVVLVGNLMTSAFRIKVLKFVPAIMLILGGLFIVRGLEMGIPFLSPKKEALHIKHNNSEEHQEGNHETCH